MKHFKIFLLALTVLFSLTAQAQTLSQISAEINKSCPKVTGVETMEKTSFSGKTFTIYYLFPDGYDDFNKRRTNVTASKESAMMWTVETYKTDMYLINRIINKKVNLRFFFREKLSGETYEITLTPQDLRTAIRRYGKMPVSLLSLNKMVADANMAAPEELDEILTFTGAELHTDCLEFKYIVDDSFLDIDDYYSDLERSQKTSAKATFASDNDNSSATLLSALYKTKRSIKYSYVGKNSGKTLSIVLDQDDLKDLMHK